MNVVQGTEEWQVLNRDGHLMAAWPTEAEARAWTAGIAYGVEAALQAIDLADLDTHSRMQGLRRIVANFGMQAKTAQVERRGEL